jgi:hypothetical protein
VVGPSTLTAAEINALLPAAFTGLPSDITVNTSTARLEAGAVAVTANGTAKVAVFGTVGWQYKLKLTVQPSWDMNDVSRVCVVAATGVLTSPGFPPPFGILPNLFESKIRAVLVPKVENIINTRARAEAEAALVRPLAKSERLSVRGVAITPDPGGVITFLPTIGAFGPIKLV